MKNNQDVNQGQLQIKEQKIKTVSAIFFLFSPQYKSKHFLQNLYAEIEFTHTSVT